MKKVSVVVPAYNEELLLPSCLGALRAQDYAGDLEIIVVDNASTDRTAAVARRHGVSVVEEPRLPSSTLVRRAVAAARPGSIILLHDGMNLTRRADQSATVRALPEIIERLRARGYGFVTVPELLHRPAFLSGWGPARPVHV